MVEEEKDDQRVFSGRKNIFADTVSNKSRASSKGHSKTVRRKLYLLFAMLLMVLLLMKEASKPENWQWMGFEANPTREGAIFLEDMGSPNPSPNANSVGENENFRTDPTELRLRETQTTQSIAQLNREFLEKIWDQQDSDGQKNLVQLLWATSHATGKSEQLTFLPKLKPLLEEFLNDKRDTIAIAILDDKEKAQRRRTIETFADLWSQKLIPAFGEISNGKDITLSQKIAAEQILPDLDSLVDDLLQDLSSPGRPSEIPAWVMYWRRITEIASDDSPTSRVSTVELRAQPKAWRGKKVTIAGNLLLGREVQLESDTAVADGKYFEWWIADDDGKGEAYSVYSSDPLPSIAVSKDLTEFNLPVEATGYFYKIRSYKRGEASLHCPLILCHSLDLQSAGSSTSTESTSEFPWVTLLIALPVIGMGAFVIAWWIDKAGREKPPTVGKAKQQAIGDHLEELKHDKEIKSDAERVRELEDGI